MKKELSEMIWPVPNYTDKIHSALKMMFSLYPLLSFTKDQMLPHLVKGYPWLANPNERQTVVLKHIIKTGIQKLVQANLVKKVTSKLSVNDQWQSTIGVAESSMINITSEDSVAQTKEARNAIKRRSIGGRNLWKLNHYPKMKV